MINVWIKKLFKIILSLLLFITIYSCSDRSDLRIKGQNIEIHFDRQLHSKVVATFNSQEIQLGDFSPAEFVIIDSTEIKDFIFGEINSERIIDSIGMAEQYTITGNNPRLKKQISVLVYDDFPDMIFIDVIYTNSDTSDIQIQSGQIIITPLSQSDPIQVRLLSGHIWEPHTDGIMIGYDHYDPDLNVTTIWA